MSQAVICLSNDINNMDFRQLRNEVQLLRDELAIMRRKYEDIIYNLDTDNFSSRFVKEQGDMRTAIEVTAEGIKTKVSNEEFESTKTQTAERIESEVKKLTDADDELSSKITQTADAIRSEVKSATETIDGKFDNYSTIEQTAKQISASVTGIYETKEDANASYGSLQGYISSVSQTASKISSRVSSVENGKFGEYTLFQQTSDTFLFDGNYMRISSAIQLTDNDGNHTFSIFHNEGEPYSAGVRATYMSGISQNLGQIDPLIIGTNGQGVYLNDTVPDNKIATQGWVLDNAGGSGGTVVAVFG